jgi:hypothetical protein
MQPVIDPRAASTEVPRCLTLGSHTHCMPAPLWTLLTEKLVDKVLSNRGLRLHGMIGEYER